MNSADAATQIQSLVAITREDIARAKSWISQSSGNNTTQMVDEWIRQHGIAEIRHVDTDSADSHEVLKRYARVVSIQVAFFKGIWELVAAGSLIPLQPFKWVPHLERRTARSRDGIDLRALACTVPENVDRFPSFLDKIDDPDIFLKGIDIVSLHHGIQEAIAQSLECFKRGLYMPATAMLGAATEAAWTECGKAVSAQLGDAALSTLIGNPLTSVSKIVTEVSKALEQKTSKALLEASGRTMHKVRDAQIWTVALLERRNALHWSKANSFIADHSETGTLLMAAPQHIGTLEAIRSVC